MPIAAADAVLIDFREGRTRLVAPDHIRYEVPSGIRNAVCIGRLSPSEETPAIEMFFTWRIPTVGDNALIEAAYHQSLRFGCSLYDGLYLSLADSIGCPLIHADPRLCDAVGPNSPLTIWLVD